MTEIPRDPSYYHPTTHAVQQRKHRKIGWGFVSDTIEEGIVKSTHKENCVLFIKSFEKLDKPIGVVASHETGEILTVEWRHKNDLL